MLVSVILFRACRRWLLAGEHARFLASRDNSLPEQAEPAGNEPFSPRKMMLGMLLTGGCYLVMGIGGLAGGDHGQVSVLWLFSGYFLLTLGELCVSPMGLSVVSKLAPP